MVGIYGGYALGALCLGMVGLGISLRVAGAELPRTGGRYLAIGAFINSLVALSYVLAMISPHDHQAIFWTKITLSCISLNPACLFLGLVHYRGNVIEERWIISLFIGTALFFGSIGWIFPETFFTHWQFYHIQGLRVISFPLTLWLFAYQLNVSFTLTITGAFVMRFFDVDAHFKPSQLVPTGGLIFLLQAAAIPLPLRIGGYPLPWIAAWTLPLATFMLLWVFLIKKPDIKLEYAVSVNPAAWHDVRNLAGALNTHIRDLHEQASELNKHQLYQIQRAALELQHYINQVSRPNPLHATYLQKEDVLINDLLRDGCDFWRFIAEKKGVHFMAWIPTETVIATIDPTWFKRVLDNLLQNAIKFTPVDGEVQVRASFTDLVYSIQVQDTGIGIAADDQAHIFQKYYRGSKAKTIEGQGLGLVTVAEFVEQHQGQIQVESQEGQGTCFHLTLPLD